MNIIYIYIHIGSFHWNVSQKKVHCIVVFVVDDIRMTFFEAEEPLQFDLPRRLTKQAIRNAVLDWIPKKSPSEVGKFDSDLTITEVFLGSATLWMYLNTFHCNSPFG